MQRRISTHIRARNGKNCARTKVWPNERNNFAGHTERVFCANAVLRNTWKMRRKVAQRLFRCGVCKGSRRSLRVKHCICDQLISHVPDKWRCEAGPGRQRSKGCRLACAPICRTCWLIYHPASCASWQGLLFHCALDHSISHPTLTLTLRFPFRQPCCLLLRSLSCFLLFIRTEPAVSTRHAEPLTNPWAACASRALPRPVMRSPCSVAKGSPLGFLGVEGSTHKNGRQCTLS